MIRGKKRCGAKNNTGNRCELPARHTGLHMTIRGGFCSVWKKRGAPIPVVTASTGPDIHIVEHLDKLSAEAGEQAAPGLREAAQALLDDELEALIESHGVAVPSRKAINRLRAALTALPSPPSEDSREGRLTQFFTEDGVNLPQAVKDAPLSADRQEIATVPMVRNGCAGYRRL